MTEEKRISTPLVLAAASGMIAIAFVVSLGMSAEEAPAVEALGPRELHIDDSTPEAAAESFYDAWRRRRWREASELSQGEAHAAVIRKQAADEALPNDERIIAERGWEALAHSPLSLALDSVDIHEDDRFTLVGVAEYQLVGRPYRREVGFEVQATPGGYRVTEMHLGEVLTELPEILRGGGVP